MKQKWLNELRTWLHHWERKLRSWNGINWKWKSACI